MPRTTSAIPVIDLFAGPGGLGEGFHAYQPSGDAVFRIGLSVENNPEAHSTLRLRSFYRQFPSDSIPSEYYQVLRGELPVGSIPALFPTEWESAADEALCATLGDQKDQEEIDRRILEVCKNNWGGPLILIGGPPCQAYSLVGRSRSSGIADYIPEKDIRHYLYKEYLRILHLVWPDIFIMENVQGILSSRLRNESVFQRILNDLKDPAAALASEDLVASGEQHYTYQIRSVSNRPSAQDLFRDYEPRDFVIQCEKHGIPQARHRVILLGVRNDIADYDSRLLESRPTLTVDEVISDLPPIRSGLSRQNDGPSEWLQNLRNVSGRRWLKSVEKGGGSGLRALIERVISTVEVPQHDRGADFIPHHVGMKQRSIDAWFIDERIGGVCNHESRGHIWKDLHRYLFAACFAQLHGRSPVLSDFPLDLMPEHRNAARAAAEGSLFSDRFRVQLADKPSTTVTSHISKDGHYYIHPDPAQCRSFTVREAARLQTFPDNYCFQGSRTAQYHQVGNAVPPLIARDIAAIVYELLVDAGRV